MSMNQVPSDLIVDVFCYLSGKELAYFREVCQKWNYLVIQGSLLSLPRVVIEDQIRICDIFGVAHETNLREQCWMADGQEHKQNTSDYVEFESISAALRNCFIMDLTVSIRSQKGVRYIKEIAEINGGIIHTMRLYFKGQCNTNVLKPLLGLCPKIIQNFDAEFVEFLLYKEDMELVIKNPSILQNSAEQIKIIAPDHLSEENVNVEELMSFIFYSDVLPEKKKLNFNTSDTEAGLLFYDTFLKDFCQNFEQTLHPETMFESVKFGTTFQIRCAWIPLLSNLGFIRSGSGMDRDGNSWHYFTKNRADEWKLKIQVKKGIYKHIWKFKVLKVEIDDMLEIE